MEKNKRYWSGLSELTESDDYQEALENEFPEVQSVDEFLSDEKLAEANAGRRDFLKFMGFSVTAATLAACETPVIKSIPYVNKPETVTPGVPNYYKTSYYDGNNYSNVLVKTREGRPIFIRANREAGAQGGVKPQVNSSVLGLYDKARLEGPTKNGGSISWADLDKEVTSALGSGRTVVLTNTVLSPTKRRAIGELTSTYGAEHVQLDSISYAGIRKANEASFGKAVIPTYHFDKAKVVVSFGADFMGTWLNSTAYEEDFAKNRMPEGAWMSKHFQVESNMSLSGSNADVRIAVKPSEMEALVAGLHGNITGSGKKMSLEGKQVQLDALVKELKANQGESIVVAESNNVNVQVVVNAINQALGNYGKTIDVDNDCHMFQGDDEAFERLVADMSGGRVQNLIMDDVNPVYTWREGAKFADAMSKVKMTLSTATVADETATRSIYVAPDHHALESWGDLQIKSGEIDLVQPTIANLFDTREAGGSFIKWAGIEDSYYTYLRKTYNDGYNETMMYSDDSWNNAVYNGKMTMPAAVEAEAESIVEDVVPGSMSVGGAIANLGKSAGAGFELMMYQKVGLGDGKQAANPWLHELPDPITKVCWDNYVTMSRPDMEELGLEMEVSQRVFPNKVSVSNGSYTVELPAIWQPGQAKGTIGIALGYGRGANNENIGKAAFQTKENGSHLTDENGNLVPIGANAFPFASSLNGTVQRMAGGITVTKLEETYPIATTQMHHTYMGRDSVVKETTLPEYIAEKDAFKGGASWNKLPALVVHEDMDRDGDMDASDKKYTKEIDLWKEHPVEGVGHRWGMTVDLTACTGCGACVTACHIENNVPVVGKDEVLRHRDMHWLRIDRFYSSDWSLEKGEEEGVGVISSYGKMEIPSDNPQTVHMPMMCQHC
ncbi:MAG: TAT-variant-translocated molybdopterin oxidoreductase, partial [Bacteroidota bacterium]